MAVSARLIRRRIKSITSTRKITKAMELVSAAKMRKAVAATLATRPYADTAWRAVEEIARRTESSLHPLLQPGAPTGRGLVIVFSTDKGLCGGINSRLLRTVDAFAAGRELDFCVLGRKGQQALRRRGANIVAALGESGTEPRFADILPAAKLATDDFIAAKYEAVWIAFTDYRSAANQQPIVRRLLPLKRVEELGEVGQEPGLPGPGENLKLQGGQYEFEPSASTVLATMLPRLVETQIFQALLESQASEHSARMLAMRSASDAASDMLSTLTLTLNQARQAGITMEIAEISSGKAALEKN
ncbi:MAG: ATP synthase F1 subunit gamma [Patescibacteria group bacterium]|nr:ATP synthase F1 subunit gamma [Patescibacteria group bacterium]